MNTGTISGSSTGIFIGGTGEITNFTNSGQISGGSNPGVKNFGSITTLNNKQGASTSPLLYEGILPTNYNVIVYSPSNYGKLVVSGLMSSTTSFGVYAGSVAGVPVSVLSAGTYSAVLDGVTSSELVSSSLTGTYGAYTWNLVNSSGSTWDLVVTGGSGGGGSSSSGNSGGGSASNIVSGNKFNIAEIGVIANPVFDGGVLTLTAGSSSSQSFRVNATGGTVESSVAGSSSLLGFISGEGRLSFTGTGTTVLSGANSYTGGTTVSSGTLSVQGNSPTGYGDVLVSSGATLMGTGTINGNIQVAGILKPGNSPGYLASTGNVTMSAGSTYQQDIAGTTQASRSTPVGATGYYSYLNVVGGQFIINAGSTLAPRVANLFTSDEAGYGSAIYVPALGDRFRIVSADGGITGKFSSLTQPSELTAGTQLMPFYNMAGSNSLDLAVIPTSYQTTIASASGNTNAQSVGNVLTQAAQAGLAGTSTAAQDQLLYSASGQTTAQSIAQYAQSLAGEVYAAAVTVMAQTTQRVQQAVLSRLGDTAGLSISGPMAGNNPTNLGGAPTAAVSSNPNVNPNTEAKTFSNGNVWGDLAYQRGNRSGDQQSGGWNSNLYQLTFGSDFYSSNGTTIGGGFALSSTTLNPVNGSATIQQGSLFAYGKTPLETFVVDAMASLGLSSSDISRGDITGLSTGFRNKTVSGNDALISLGLSRPIEMESVRITPYARVTWQIVSQSGINEGDVASALTVNRYTGNGVRGVIGVAAGSKANNPMTAKHTYRAYVGVGADSSGLLNPTLNASLAGIGTNISTPNAGTTFVQAGVYGTAKLSDNTFAYAGLAGEARSGQTLGTVNVGLKVQF
ncbi:MAG: autotransporter domain-containing protein [Burkholderiaceae bacterium]|nr:autotransporter domain-containing protein [Burkholderiaceae bacterium]